VVFLACDAFGVLPPVAKFDGAQAMYHFLSGGPIVQVRRGRPDAFHAKTYCVFGAAPWARLAGQMECALQILESLRQSKPLELLGLRFPRGCCFLRGCCEWNVILYDGAENRCRKHADREVGLFQRGCNEGISAPFNTPVVAVQLRMSYSFVSVPTSCSVVVAHV
jgi:phosphoenolpyruvate carboxykinase-like protein